MTGLKLRWYQEESLAQIREKFKKGIKKVMLVLPTGAGKTLCFCKILHSVHMNNKKAILVVHGIELVENASQRLFLEDVTHGVLQGNHFNKRPNENIQVCSITTLYRRKLAPEADILIIDEAHMATSKSYKWLAEQYPNAFFMPVTATPNVKQGLKHIADDYVAPIAINGLIEEGFLVPPKYFSPSKVDVSGVRIDSNTGDYVVSQLEKTMDDISIYGDLVDNYKKRGENRKALIFAVTVEHSKKIKDHFNNAGIPCEHIDAKTPRAVREEIFKKLENGEIQAISNVGVLTVGVDIPCLGALIFARPTMSYNLWIQMCGRGTRLYPGKKDFLIFDHVGNISKHGFIEDEREVLLNGWKEQKETNSILNCEKCYVVFSSRDNYKKVLKENFDEDEERFVEYYNNEFPKLKRGDRAFKTKLLYICPECEHDNTPIADPIIRKTGETEDILMELSDEEKLDIKVKTRLKELKNIKKSKGYKRGWVYFTLKAEFGEEMASKFVKKRVMPEWVKKKITS